jgi:hypothetical protein
MLSMPPGEDYVVVARPGSWVSASVALRRPEAQTWFSVSVVSEKGRPA